MGLSSSEGGEEDGEMGGTDMVVVERQEKNGNEAPVIARFVLGCDGGVSVDPFAITIG